MKYDELLERAYNEGLTVKKLPLQYNDGRIKHKRIAIRSSIPTTVEKTCVLAEELGHYYTSVGNIIDQTETESRKQELRARMWAYNDRIGLIGIVRAYRKHCTTLYEMAKELDVTESFLAATIQRYREKFGLYATVDNYIVYFEPYLTVVEQFE